MLTTCVQHGKTDLMLARLNLTLKDQCNIGDFAVLLLESHGYIVGEDGSLVHPDFDYVLTAGETARGGSRAAKRPAGEAGGEATVEAAGPWRPQTSHKRRRHGFATHRRPIHRRRQLRRLRARRSARRRSHRGVWTSVSVVHTPRDCGKRK